MFDNPGYILFVIAVILVVGSFAFGTQYNVRRGNNAVQWLQQGLPLVGEKTTFRWLGSSAVELKLAKAKDPFRSFEVMIVLEPRDIPIFWALGRLEGRRDLIILRSQLVRAPRFELQAHSPAAWKTARAKSDSTRDWTPLEHNVNELRVAYRGAVAADVIQGMLAQARWGDLRVTRLTVSRSVPNLELHFLFPNFDRVPATRVLSGLRELSETALKI